MCCFTVYTNKSVSSVVSKQTVPKCEIQKEKRRERERVSRLVFYAQSTSLVISGRYEREREGGGGGGGGGGGERKFEAGLKLWDQVYILTRV